MVLQALAQCQTFLSASLPQARRLPTSSTAGAARSLLEEGGEKGAAICSRGVVQVLEGLEVATEGIEDMSGASLGPFSLICLCLFDVRRDTDGLGLWVGQATQRDSSSFTPPRTTLAHLLLHH